MSKARGPIHLPVGSSGFTLLELIVVLAGLGILSSLAIPNYMRYLDYAKVDEAKSLLNNAAADCLQGLRRAGENSLTSAVNSDIISYTRLKNTGYTFKEVSGPVTDEEYLPKCSAVLITASQDDDRTGRLPDLGFTLSSDGTLTKIAVNSGGDTEYAAESWAGKNTTNEDALIKWQELNNSIAEEKAICKNNRINFANNTGTGETRMWDQEATSKCTSKPPIDSNNLDKCTPSGCTKPIWYIDGEICGYSSTEFRECQKQKTTAACQAEKDLKSSEQPPWTTRTIDGDRLPNCEEPTWFIDGEDVGSSGAWKLRMCERNKKDLLTTTYSGPIEYCDEYDVYYICAGEEILGDREVAKAKFETCLANDKNAICTTALNNDALTKSNGGPYTSPTPSDMTAPIGDDCNEQYWYCSGSGKVHREPGAEEKYKADTKCQKNCDHLRNYTWCDLPSRYKSGRCRAYSLCMGRVE